MIHQASGGARGTASDVERTVEFLYKLNRRMKRIIAHHTGQPEEKVNRDCDRDYFMTAQEAKDYGLVDEVVSSRKDIPNFAELTKMTDERSVSARRQLRSKFIDAASGAQSTGRGVFSFPTLSAYGSSIHDAGARNGRAGFHAPARRDRPAVTASPTFAGSKALLVVFLCAHCPYVVHVRPELARIAADYADRGVGIVGITSNDVAQYPGDAPAPTAHMAEEAGLNFPDSLRRNAGSRARLQRRVHAGFLPVRSRIASWSTAGRSTIRVPSRGVDRPGRGTLDGKDIRAALDAVLAGQPVSAGSAAEHRVQYQVEAGQRAGVVRLVGRDRSSIPISGKCFEFAGLRRDTQSPAPFLD